MKLTLQKKFFLGILLVAGAFVALFAAVYTTQYDNYVVYRKKLQLVEAYNYVVEAYREGGTVGQDVLQTVELDSGVRILTTDEAGYIDYNSLLLYSDRPWNPLLFAGISRFKLSELVPQAFGSDAYFTITEDKTELGYVLFTAGDRTTGMQFLGLLGSFGADRLMLLQLPTPVIESAAEYTGFFLLWVGLAALLLATLLGYFLSRSLTRKVSEIHSIAEGMAGLDFSRRYTGEADDDIGELGVSINKLSEHLEETIDELKQEIAHAKELEEARKNLIRNVSHELKTPIAIIQGYAEGLKENVTGDAESRAFYCGVIEDESKHMGRLVGELLSVSRIEAGATKPQPEDFELDALIEGVMRRVGGAAEKRGLDMRFTPAGETVYADEGMTEQVLYNYLSNAVDHAPDGGAVEVGCERTQGGALRVTVYNEGEPIPEEDIPRIWESFYKVDKSRARAFGGTGIGLSIVKAAMEAQHMAYGVENREGGVAFWFELCLAQSKDRHIVN
ncbi:MAG TPA: HAMP domain-containing sensor histidine kinase [Candidatus Acidoferrum sp.]|nr:HAMP domain-containing sensor histidine kinase [Candidatus Acidoferrum sp.]